VTISTIFSGIGWKYLRSNKLIHKDEDPDDGDSNERVKKGFYIVGSINTGCARWLGGFRSVVTEIFLKARNSSRILTTVLAVTFSDKET